MARRMCRCVAAAILRGIVVGYTTVAPSISFERLEKLVKENSTIGRQPQVEKETIGWYSRDIRLIDKYGLPSSSSRRTSIVMRSRSAYLLTDKPLDDPGQFVLPSVEGRRSRACRDDQRQHNPDLHPVPTLTPVLTPHNCSRAAPSRGVMVASSVDNGSHRRLCLAAPCSVRQGCRMMPACILGAMTGAFMAERQTVEVIIMILHLGMRHHCDQKSKGSWRCSWG